jgi:hypothetical protein
VACQGTRGGNARKIAYFLLGAISIVMARGSGRAPVSSAPVMPSSITSPVESLENQPAIQHGLPVQPEAERCSLHVPDTDSRPDDKAGEGTTANEPLAYTPLSGRCKFKLFLSTTYSPYTFLSAGFQATLDQAEGQWPHYGGGMQGWGKRFGATLADTESRRFIQSFALSTILHEDPRYFPSRKKTLISRAWYAATRVVITRNDNGYSGINKSEFLGALFTSALQNAYYPRHDRTFGDTMDRFGGALSSDALGDLLREFTPDMKRLFRKHAPRAIQRMEQKLPIPADDKV